MSITIDLNSLLYDPQFTALFRIVLAGLVGGLIGLEREMAGKPAGIRTYGLVGMGAAMFCCVAIFGFGSYDFGSRIVGSVITGIGFLGAGTILHTKLHVVGLTTAAGMWVAAAVGMAIGLGMYAVGVGAGVLLFVLLQFASPEELIRSRRHQAGMLDAAEEEEIAEHELAQRLEPAHRGAMTPQATTAQAVQLATWAAPGPQPFADDRPVARAITSTAKLTASKGWLAVLALGGVAVGAYAARQIAPGRRDSGGNASSS
jgi:uncharacterized membrane protein YhiD involved in acid resistance